MKTRDHKVNTPGLVQLAGRRAGGEWVLEVSDEARADTGRMVSFTLRLYLCRLSPRLAIAAGLRVFYKIERSTQSFFGVR